MHMFVRHIQNISIFAHHHLDGIVIGICWVAKNVYPPSRLNTAVLKSYLRIAKDEDCVVEKSQTRLVRPEGHLRLP
ncbi:hypothetical protein MRX96_007773 [Rhipicephalus microplus]